MLNKSIPMNGKLLSIRNELRKLGNKEIAEHSQRFFRTGDGQYGEGDRFLGIRVPVLRKLARKHRGCLNLNFTKNDCCLFLFL